MILPGEPAILSEISSRVEGMNVYLITAGGSWLRAVVEIRKGKRIMARERFTRSFAVSVPSNKLWRWIAVVDQDIGIRNPEEVEWATSTRFQVGAGLVLPEDVTGLFLDPIVDEHTTHLKEGSDAIVEYRRKREESRGCSRKGLIRAITKGYQLRCSQFTSSAC